MTPDPRSALFVPQFSTWATGEGPARLRFSVSVNNEWCEFEGHAGHWTRRVVVDTSVGQVLSMTVCALENHERLMGETPCELTRLALVLGRL